MNIRDRKTRIEHTETFYLEDGEIRPVPFSSSGRVYRVSLVIIQSYNETGKWVTRRPELRGQVLKKDGTDSANRTTESLWGHENHPDWLAELVATATKASNEVTA